MSNDTHDPNEFGAPLIRNGAAHSPRRRIPWLPIGVVAFVILMVGLSCQVVFFPQTVISQGNSQETTLNSAAGKAFGAFHLCVVNTARAAQVAGAQTDAVSQVLEKAVGGRYGVGAELDLNSVYVQLKGAYPDLTGLDSTFRDAMTIMTGCQKSFLDKQDFMNSRANDFERWKTGNWFARNYGGDKYPNDILRVTIGSTIHRGQDALDIMQRQVLDTDTVNALETGIDQTTKDDPFHPKSPASQPSPS